MADAESSDSSDDKGENKDMPPPCLPAKNPQRTRLSNGETVEHSQSNENKEPKSSSQDLKEQTPPEFSYKVPSWSGIPDDFYSLEVLKNGCIISTIDITSKPYHVFGRLPNCDVSLEHPSVSRYHAVIQYKASESSKSDKGFYIYDLGSTHGTVVNKARLEARRYYRLRVGYVIKFGGSSRLFILQGPEEHEESDSIPPMEEAVSSSRDVGCVMSEEEYEEWKREREGGRSKDEEDTGIDWGIGEDAVEEPAYQPDFGDEDLEEHHFKDPKKTLRGFYEREGLELEYDVEEKGPGHARVYHCKVKLPIDGPGGEPLYAEAAVAGKKKESVLECAKEACRMLDAAGLLRQSTHESKKHKEKNWEENDYYDSDEDTFLDRTGSVEKKRLLRMKRAGKDDSTLETYESLTSKLEALNHEIKCRESKLQQNSKNQKNKDANVADSLDDYMRSLDVTLDKATISQIRRKLFDLKKERQRLTKLVNIAKPASLPSLSGPYPSELESVNDKVSGKPQSKGNPSDSTVSTTVDTETDKRHEEVIPPEEKRTTKDFVDNADSSEEVADLNAQQSPGEFVVSTEVQHIKRKHSRPRGFNQEASKSDQSKIVQPPIDDNQRSPIDVSRTEADHSQWSQNKKADEKEKDAEIPKKKKKRSYGAPSQWEAVSDPTYSAWMPPAGQTGDGRTHLNEKFGY